MHGYPLFRRVRAIPDLGRVIAAIKVTPIPPVGAHPRVSFGVFDWALPVGNLLRGSIVVRGVTVSFTERASEIRHYYCGLPSLLDCSDDRVMRLRTGHQPVPNGLRSKPDWGFFGIA